MSQSPPPQYATSPASTVPLDYAQPARQVVWTRFLVSLAATFLFSLGGGAVTFASLMLNIRDDTFCTIFAVGVTFLLMGAGLLISWRLAQR